MRLSMLVCTAALTLAGCSGFVQMMPRDSGKVYSGTVQGGSPGSMTIQIDDETFTGPIVRTSSGDSFGLVQQYGRRGSSVGSVAMVSGNATVKAMLSSPSGRGLRCDFTSDGSGGAGVCVDDRGRVLDAIVGR